MPAFTVKNLKQLDDLAAGTPDVELRFGREPLETEHLGVSYMRLGPGFRSQIGHRHKTQEEVYVVVSGSGRMRLDDEIIEIAQWDAVRVSPTTTRALEGGPEGMELIITGSDRPPEGDGEMIPEWWVD